MTHEQVDDIEDKLRAAQKLVEECGAAICEERGYHASLLLNNLTSISNKIGDEIHQMWRLRPEDQEDET